MLRVRARRERRRSPSPGGPPVEVEQEGWREEGGEERFQRG